MRALRTYLGLTVNVYLDGDVLQGVLVGASADAVRLEHVVSPRVGDLKGVAVIPAAAVIWVQVIVE